MNTEKDFKQFENLDEEYLPVAKHKLHDWTHFAGLYAAEHVAATEFVIGATFVALGCQDHGYHSRATDRQYPWPY